MNQLLAGLIQSRDPIWAALAVATSLFGAMAFFGALEWNRRRSAPRRALLLALLVPFVTTATFAIFVTALMSAHPNIDLVIPAPFLASALALSTVGNAASIFIILYKQHSIRNVLFAASIMASGFSCMTFTALSGMVAPFALSFDLTGVVAVMIVATCLLSCSLWESTNARWRHPLVPAVLLGAGCAAFAGFGSIACILSFGDWMNAVMQPNDITSQPIVAVTAAEGAFVLAFGLFGSVMDNRAAARDQLEADRLRQLADSTFEAILIHRDGVALDGNEALARLVGLSGAALKGLSIETLILGDRESLVTTSSDARRFEGEVAVPGGARIPVEILSRTIRFRGGQAVVTALRDITERRLSEARIRFLAHHDMLTELPNRARLQEELSRSLATSRATGSPLAVLCLDLDGFKAVNDEFGHAVGDGLLRQVAERLRACLDVGDIAARIGGDEFVVVQTGADQPSAADRLGQRIIARLSEVFAIEGHKAHIGTSIGVAIHPSDGDAPERLLERADMALYRAKRSGRGCLRFFDTGTDRESSDHIQIEKDLRCALAKGEISLAYQPIFDGALGLRAFEALLRWTHPVHGPVPPERFVPIAEARGLIAALGGFALREACRTAAAWPLPCRIAVNLSPVQFGRTDFVREVAGVLAETRLAPERLELEITEGVLLQDTEEVGATIEGLAALGVRIVLDDFGTGYCNLGHLQRLPLSKLKIDRSFVMHLPGERTADVIVGAVVAMGRELGLDINAEGVETEEQLDALRLKGVDEIQGFLLSRPITASEADALVRDRALEISIGRLRGRVAELRRSLSEQIPDVA